MQKQSGLMRSLTRRQANEEELVTLWERRSSFADQVTESATAAPDVLKHKREKVRLTLIRVCVCVLQLEPPQRHPSQLLPQLKLHPPNPRLQRRRWTSLTMTSLQVGAFLSRRSDSARKKIYADYLGLGWSVVRHHLQQIACIISNPPIKTLAKREK